MHTTAFWLVAVLGMDLCTVSTSILISGAHVNLHTNMHIDNAHHHPRQFAHHHARRHAPTTGLKAYTTAFTARALNTCREACGGHGYAAVNRLGAMRSDHDIFQTFEGDNTVLLQQVSALLLKEYREQFLGAPLAATWVYLRQWARDSMPQNPLITHETSAAHLRDPAFLRHALR